MLTLLREISIRHLVHSPLRTALVVFGISLGVCMLSAILAVNASLIAAFEDMVDRVAGKADLTVAGSAAGVHSSLTGEIADLEGVAHAAAMLEVTTRTPSGDGGAILVLGVDFLGDKFFLPFAQEDSEENVVEDPLVFVNDPTAILISEKLAKSRGLEVGSQLELMTSEGATKFNVHAILKDEGPASSFGGQVVVMAIDAAQVTFARGYAVDRIDIVVEEGADKAVVLERIDKMLNGRARVEAPQGRTQRLVASLWAFQNGLNMSGIVALWVGMFLIYNAVAVSVAQRRREVGVLRALGVTKGQMVRLICLESLVMAIIGTLIGLAMAQYLASFALDSVTGAVDRFMMAIRPPDPDVTPQIAAAGAFSGIVCTLIAAYLPAKRTNRVDPAEALRSSRSTSSSGKLPINKLAVIGAALAVGSYVPTVQGTDISGYVASTMVGAGFACMVPLAVVLIRRLFVVPAERLMGIPGRLAVDNVERSLGRSAITVVSLMLAVGMSSTLGSYMVSFEDSVMQWMGEAFPADVIVTSGSPMVDRRNIPFAPDVLTKLEGIDGVEAVNPVRIVEQDIGKHRAQIYATDTAAYRAQANRRGTGRRILEGPDTIAVNALAEGEQVIISENIAGRYDYEAGGTIPLDTPTGRREFRIYAVVVDYSSGGGWIMMDRKWYVKYYQDETVDEIDLYLADAANKAKTEAISDEVKKRLGATDQLFVSRNEDLRAEVRGATASLFKFAKAPELVTLLVAIMGVIGTMLAAVIDRIREVGMLRAIGATRRQVTGSIVAEAGFLGFSAVVWGTIAGIPMGWIFTRVIGYAASGWVLPYQFPVETALRVGLLVVFTGALAGFFPGRRAAGMDVKEALAYE